MDTYTVVATIQSPDNDPVEVKWYSGNDPLKALVAVGQCIEHHVDKNPAPVRVRLLNVTLTVVT